MSEGGGSRSPAILGGEPVFAQGPPSWPPQREDVQKVLGEAYRDGAWGRYHGRYSQSLSDWLAELHSARHVELCCSGTVAVELALRGLRIGPGDEVVLAAYDFKGNFTNVLAVGAQPVLVDIAPGSSTLAVDQLQAAVGPATRAILVSHLHGATAPMPQIRQFAEEHGLAVIEDACQMPGAWVQGKRAGCWGDVGVLSFGGSKLLSAGRGGAVFTNDAAVAQRIRLHCRRGNHAYPLSELQAAVVLPQLGSLDVENARRLAAAAWLTEALEQIDGLTPLRREDDGSEPGYYKFGLWYDPDWFDGLTRRQFTAAMQAEGVALFPGFRALHLSHSRRRFRQAGDLPNASRADESMLVLHHPILLRDPHELEKIVLAVRVVQRHARELKTRLPESPEWSVDFSD